MESSMNKIITLLFISVAVMTQASNNINPEILKRIDADIALMSDHNQYTKSGIPTFVTVGADDQCTYNTIQSAINDIFQAPIDFDIRIANNKIYSENVNIPNMNATLIGGYSNCQAAINGVVPNGETLIQGGASGSVIQMESTTQRRTIIFQNLFIFNGSTNFGAGIKFNQVNTRTFLIDVKVSNNNANQGGGGVAIIGGDTDMTLQNSIIGANNAKYGGGIYCSGAESSIVISENSGLILNNAIGTGSSPEGQGGGAYIDGCYFGMYSGSVSDDLVGINDNIAKDEGGGIYATNNALILLNGHENCNSNSCIGDEINPVSMSRNESENSGGGISSFNSSVEIFAALIKENDGGSRGGAINIRGEGLLDIARLHLACWDDLHCNYFEGNSSILGGAIFNQAARVEIGSAYFENNVANVGAAIYSFGIANGNDFEFFTRVEGCVFNNNGSSSTQSIFYSFSGGESEYIHNTIADNNAQLAIFDSKYDNVDDATPFLQIYSSIIDNPGNLVLNHDIEDYEVVLSCIIANETTSISTSNNIINLAESFFLGTQISQGDPEFVDRNNKDYHLSPASTAIDTCRTPLQIPVVYKDIDFEERGSNDPNSVDFYYNFFYDIGADEFYLNDLIFKHGFES